MTVTTHMYSGHDDFMRIRQFLMDTYKLNQTYHNWETRRWEGQLYWGVQGDATILEQRVCIWENEQDEIVGVVHPEGDELGNAWLEIHPEYRHLEREMLDWAENNLAGVRTDKTKKLSLSVYEYDTFRQELLKQRGYTQSDGYGFLRWRQLDTQVPSAKIPDDYIIRSLRVGNRDDARRWGEVVNAVFGHANATEETISHFQTSPSYRHDLHIIAEAENGDFAAFAGLTIDEMNRTAVFEPVGTHPDHRRKGLAQAVMCEGMRRLKALNIEMVYVGTGDMIPANKLYESLGFTEYHKDCWWDKVF